MQVEHHERQAIFVIDTETYQENENFTSVATTTDPDGDGSYMVNLTGDVTEVLSEGDIVVIEKTDEFTHHIYRRWRLVDEETCDS